METARTLSAAQALNRTQQTDEPSRRTVDATRERDAGVPGTPHPTPGSGDTAPNSGFRGHRTQLRVPGTPHPTPGFRGHHTQLRSTITFDVPGTPVDNYV
jgi:hypothetical protein